MIDSRDIDDLNPYVGSLCQQFVSACKRQGIDVIITSTLRDNEAQDALYAIGRTVRGPNPTLLRPMGQRRTNARGGQSYHNYGLAFDFAPLQFGKPAWEDIKLYTECGEIGEALGLDWAGRWKTFRELAHLQWTDGLNITQLQAGMRPNTPEILA